MQYGNTRIIRVNAAVDTAAHTAGDVVANLALGVIAAPNRQGVLKDVSITDDANVKAALTLLFFDGAVTGTYTLNGAPVISEADAANFLGKVEVAASDYTTIGAKAVATVECAIVLRSSAAKELTCIAVCSGTPDYTAADDLRFKFGILGD